MSIWLSRPTRDDLGALIEAARTAPVAYDPVGMSALAQAPPGYRLDHWSRRLGRGDDVFNMAADALRSWRVHRGAGLVVWYDGPPAVGAVVAMAARLPVGYIEAVCRVVDVVDQPDRYGFAYGTLAVHPEQGEESFTVVRTADGSVSFEIAAVSRPRHLLARACPPGARILQRAATGRYLDSMSSAVTP